MKVPDFLREVVWTLFPKRYPNISIENFSKSVRFLSSILLFAVLVSGIIYIPEVISVKSMISQELEKLQVNVLAVNFTTSSPMMVPQNKPLIVVDSSGEYNLTSEMFVLSGANLHYRWFGKKSVPVDQLLKPKEYPATVSRFATFMFFMLLPAIALMLYLRLWLKYVLLGLLLSSILFILFELSKYKLRWKQMGNIVFHASLIPILVEVISAPFIAEFLVPTFRFLGVHVYAVTLGVWFVLSVIGVIFVQVYTEK